MKVFAVSIAVAAALAQTASDRPPTRNVGSMSELMVKIIYPTSDALFYVESRTPKTESEWTALEGQALMLAESANLLMMPGRARDQKQWMAPFAILVAALALIITAMPATAGGPGHGDGRPRTAEADGRHARSGRMHSRRGGATARDLPRPGDDHARGPRVGWAPGR